MVEISLAILILLIGPAGFYVIANEWFGVSGWIGVGKELVDFFECRRQSDQVSVKAFDQRGPVGFR